MDVSDQDRLAAGGGQSGDAFTQRDHEMPHHLVPVPDAIANAEPSLALAIEQNCEQIVGYDLFHNGGDVGQYAIQVERF